MIGDIDTIRRSEYDPKLDQCVKKDDNNLKNALEDTTLKIDKSLTDAIKESKNYQLRQKYSVQLGDSIDSVFAFKEVE